MFTGIVQGTVNVAWVNHGNSISQYALNLPDFLLNGLQVGASICVEGVCQTVVSIQGQEVAFDVMAQTLKCTTLCSLKPGQSVNIERAMKMGDEIGGHLIAGHIIGTASISNCVAPHPEQRDFTIHCHPNWMKYILPKGFIALNGVSLTVGETDDKGYFTVHLIPETLRSTTFKNAQEGDKINIELDSQTQTIVDTVEKVLAKFDKK